MDVGLVYVGKIVSLSPIDGADFILLATVVCGSGGKWRGVVKKESFKLDDLCIVYLPDALVPPSEEMKFLESSKWRVMMRNFKGCPSEVVIMPYQLEGDHWLGKDVTEFFGVKKYVKEIPANLACKAKSYFPSFIPKTDEPNYQSSDPLIELLKGHPYFISEKADGSSTTAYQWKGQFGVCSRNLELIEDPNNGYWQIANEYNLKENLPEGYAIQWETCGPKIQKNPMGLKKVSAFAFNVWDIEDREYLGFHQFLDFCKKLGFPTVNIVEVGDDFRQGDLTLRAKGKYSNGKDREGIVIRSIYNIFGHQISFKSINLDYKE